jgi:hypothetical protein
MTLTTVNPALLDTQAQYTGFKNRIINGAMVIDQRNAGASVSGTSGVFTLDRWKVQNNSGAARFTVQQNAGSVTPPAGFSKYLGVTSTGAYSVASGDVISIVQVIEGNNIADFSWGTAGASTATLSFKVRSSLTGTFGGSIKAAGATSYPFTFTISAANTWEDKTVAVSAPTSGTFATDNSAGVEIYWSMGTGASFNGTAGAWAAADYRSATGATSVVGTSGATFYITGVQLEKGSTATAFDYRPYGTELALCQRYCIVYGGDNAYERFANCINSSTTQALGMVSFPVQMRAAPSISSSGSFGIYNGSTVVAVTSVAADSPSSKVSTVAFNTASGLSANAYTQAIANASTATRLIFSAEL